jgi:sulfate permease, SulP family
VSTSLSASSLNDHSGARTGLASIVSGVTVLLALLFLAPLFSGLPKPVLAALIIEAVVMGMMDVAEMRRLARVQRFDFWIALIAIVATLLVGVLAGVVVGVVLSLLWLIAVTTHPQLPELGRQRGTTAYRDVEAHPEDELDPTVAVLRIDGGLFFASCEAVEDRTRDLIHERQNLRGLVLDCAGVNFIDSQGTAQMAAIGRLARQAGLDLQLARVKPAVVDALGRDGFLDLLGRDHLHGNVDQAVRMVRRSDRNGTD